MKKGVPLATCPWMVSQAIKRNAQKQNQMIRIQQEPRHRVVSLFSGILGLELGLSQLAAQLFRFLWPKVHVCHLAYCRYVEPCAFAGVLRMLVQNNAGDR